MNQSRDAINQTIPTTGRLAGIDYGTVRIGIAISDFGRTIASPLENYNRRDQRQDERYFQQLASEEEIVAWIVGLPIHTDGNESQKSIEARSFGKWLAETTSLPVTWCDERYSSQFAENLLNEGGLTSKQRKKRKDMLAAQIILSAYLESHGESQSNHPLSDD